VVLFFSEPQHFHVGVNGWLIIRRSNDVCFTPLQIGRCDLGHGSSSAQLGPTLLQRASGNIEAIRFPESL
jgi:hypothetical protein